MALARALAAKPRLLLLDEPFSSLDENLREEMRTLVLRLHRSFRMTTILVTHDREEALAMSDRVALLFDGGILQCGTPREVYAHPISRRAADYFGDCAYLPGRVKDGVFTGAHLRLDTALPDGPYELMLRSSALLTEQAGEFPLLAADMQFRGGDTVVTLQSPEGAVWKKAFSSPPDWRAGQRLFCRADAAQGTLFPADDFGRRA